MKFNYLVFILIFLAILSFFFLNNSIKREGFEQLHPNLVAAEPRLLDSYPSTGRSTVNENTHSDIWWYYPIFKVGSYAQITNNLKNRRNPDDGECRTADFCGALYKDKTIESNIVHPLPPVPVEPGTRVNYYRTPDNLFLGPQPGALCDLPAF